MKFLVYVLILSSTVCFSQKESAYWYFGHNAGLNFNSGTPVAETGKLRTDEGCAAISSDQGELLFYTDGSTVYNANHVQMQNGNNLMGDLTSTNSAIIVPKPNHPDIYFIFTTPAGNDSDGLRYNEVDMAQDGGLGALTIKNQLLATPVMEKMTAVKTDDNTGYWVIVHHTNGDEFLSFKVTDNGVSTTPIISKSGYSYNNDDYNGYHIGAMKFSPNGSKLAIASNGHGFELHDFDSNSGVVSNSLLIREDTYAYGIEFSPNGELIYLCSPVSGLFQMNISLSSLSEIKNSQHTLINGGGASIWALQLGLDGKIYLSVVSARYLSVINNPNELGDGCNYVQRGVELISETKARLGLPVFIQSYFYTSLEAENFCLGSATHFKAVYPESYNSIQWNFGDGQTSNEESPSHTYANPGGYTVTLDIITTSYTESETIDINIIDLPSTEFLREVNVCSGVDSISLSGYSDEFVGYATDVAISYFGTEDDAFQNESALIDPVSINGLTTVYVRLSSVNSPYCFSVGSFNINMGNLEAGDLDQLGVCSPNNSSATINFINHHNKILNGRDASQYSIGFYNTEEDAVNDINALPDEYISSSDQTLYYRLGAKNDPTCFDVKSVELVIAIPAITESEFSLCGSDGYTSFALSQFNTEILGDLDQEKYTVKYYNSEDFAINETSELDQTNEMTNPIADQFRVFARIDHVNLSCALVGPIEILVSSSLSDIEVTDWQICQTNGVWTTTVNLTDKTSEILGSLDANTNSVTYYISESDAINNNNPIESYVNNTPQDTIYFKVASNGNGSCSTIGNFDLIVQATDVNLDEIEVCGNHQGIITFDLSTLKNGFLGNQDESTHIVSHFLSEDDALNNTNAINPYSFTNNEPFKQTIFVKIQHTSTACISIEPFTFYVSPMGEGNEISDWSVCDTDGDGLYSFDLTRKNSEILDGLDESTYSVSYYDNLDDAQDGTNKIGADMITSGNKAVYYRISNSNNPTCYLTGTFMLKVGEGMTLNPKDQYFLCTIGDVAIEDFNYILIDLIDGDDVSQFNFSMYESDSDALNSTNSISQEKITENNTYDNQVFMRVEDRNQPECYALASTRLIVSQKPSPQEPTDWSSCNANGNSAVGFDLSKKNGEILSGLSSDAYNISYHTSEDDALNHANPLNNSISLDQSRTIYFNVYNRFDPDCNSVGQFEIVISSSLDVSAIADFETCGVDGIATFDLKLKKQEIINIFGNNWEVSFFETEADMTTSSNALIQEFYTNTQPNEQIIYFSINDPINGCSSSGNFLLKANQGLEVEKPKPYISCDPNNTEGIIINLSEKKLEILNSLTTTNYDLIFFNSWQDANENYNTLDEQAILVSGTTTELFARISSENSDCYTIITQEIIINELPQPLIEQNISMCEGSDVIIDGGDFDSWEWLDANNTIIGTDRMANLSNPGQYILWVGSAYDGIVCENFIEFNINTAEEHITDFNYQLIQIDNQNIIEISGEHGMELEYSLDGENFKEGKSVNLNPGYNMIFVRPVNGCNVVSKLIFIPRYKKFFSPNGDGYNDKWFISGDTDQDLEQVKIYSRYGKLLKTIKDVKQGWDGTYNGRDLPADDYWFQAIPKNGTEFKGHFALMR